VAAKQQFLPTYGPSELRLALGSYDLSGDPNEGDSHGLADRRLAKSRLHESMIEVCVSA
jgi:hypothetical protein